MIVKQRQFIGVTQEQIAAAQEMWEQLPDWQHYDQVLALANSQFPDNTRFESALLKVGLLDRLYSTKVYDLVQAANRVVQVFGTMPHISGIDKVMQLSDITSDGKKHLTSFASKYVHFFHDNSVPIYDWYAAFALTRHLDCPQNQVDKWRENFTDYCGSLDYLERKSGVSPKAREMDRYMWLVGNWVWLQKHREKARINKELRAFFDDPVKAQFAGVAFRSLLR